MSVLNIVLFGPPRVERDGAEVHFYRGQTLALLAYLAAADRPHARDALATLFWPEQDEQQAHAALRRILYDLGRTIGKGWLAFEDHHMALPAQPGLHVDVRRFSALHARVAAHGHVSNDLCDDCLAALTEAASLYQDDFLTGFTLRGSASFDAWQTLTTESLRLELGAGLEKLAGALLDRGRYDQALPHARRWLALDPLHEASHRLLMRLYAAVGDRAAVIRQYEQCNQVLAAELGVAPAPETIALYRELAPGQRSAPPKLETAAAAQPAAAPPRPNLPPDVTPFIGRKAELRVVAQRLADPHCRLLTIFGPGGIGKTRLAIQAARCETAHYAHGVYFVDLTPVSSAELLSTAILHVLQAPPQAGGELDERLLDFVRDKQMLLVLDNYEHLLSGPEPDRRDGYSLVARLTAAAPQVKLLVTSRVRLNVPQEWLAPLEGLATPPPSPHGANRDENLALFLSGALAGAERVEPAVAGPQPNNSVSAATLRRYSATALFLQCIRRVRPEFRPNAAEAHTIAHICRLLEGAPLAIELAAAWTRFLPLDEIARHLEQGLSLLTSSLRGAPPRQRSIIAAFDQSWRLLTSPERSLLRQLAVFRGGFTRRAAQAVAGADLADLASLADASWLRMTAGGRCVLHELIRQYCADKLEREHLAEAGETADQVRQRHAAYYQSALASLWEEFFRRRGAIPEITPDLGNLLAAWDWSLLHDDPATAWALSCGLGFLADRQGRNQEMARVFELGLARLRADHAARRGDLVVQRGRAAFLVALLANQCERFSRIGQTGDAQACLQEAETALAAAEPDDAQWAEARWFYGRMAAWMRHECGDFAGSMRLFQGLQEEIRAHRVQIWPYGEDSTTIWLTETYELMGFDALALGEYEEARRLATEGMDIAAQHSLPYCRAWVSYPLIGALLSLGQYAQAEETAQRFVSEARAFADDLMLTQATAMLGHAQLAMGRHDAARAAFQQGLAMAQRSGLRVIIVSCLVGLGNLELALGHLPEAQGRYAESCAAAPSLLAGALVGLGRVALSQGQPCDALAYLRQALSAPVRSAALTAEALAYAAEALLRQGDLTQPVTICAFLLRWPGATYCVQQIARTLLDEIAVRLPPEEWAAALAQGEQCRLEDLVAPSTFPRTADA
ncbi:MAG: hypothetical protein BroJett021_26030 [Chloroflexota bacterium]|nr:tetratricopeptide repeat protein [Caldilinea sp.]GIK73615.1 MAG: hypothetical protein BroJett021_26030 [Chloroflexota bacterium]